MRKFETGKNYTTRSIGDHDCVWSYTVTERPAQTVTLSDGKKTIKCKIVKQLSEYRNAETVRPLGNYSMCPLLSA